MDLRKCLLGVIALGFGLGAMNPSAMAAKKGGG
jgi:hypothetical protein